MGLTSPPRWTSQTIEGQEIWASPLTRFHYPRLLGTMKPPYLAAITAGRWKRGCDIHHQASARSAQELRIERDPRQWNAWRSGFSLDRLNQTQATLHIQTKHHLKQITMEERGKAVACHHLRCSLSTSGLAKNDACIPLWFFPPNGGRYS